jgi:hypothetical protein
MCVCVCGLVSMGEREREREGERAGKRAGIQGISGAQMVEGEDETRARSRESAPKTESKETREERTDTQESGRSICGGASTQSTRRRRREKLPGEGDIAIERGREVEKKNTGHGGRNNNNKKGGEKNWDACGASYLGLKFRQTCQRRRASTTLTRGSILDEEFRVACDIHKVCVASRNQVQARCVRKRGRQKEFKLKRLR